MPALLVVTRERLAMITNGQVALEVPREWLRPSPRLAAENGIRLYISPDSSLAEPDPMLLRARAGRGAAAELVAVLTGRTLPLQPDSSSVYIPSWKEKIGASAPVALPTLDEGDAGQPAGATRPTWPPVEQQGILAQPKRRPQEDGRPMQAILDQRRANVPVPTPVPSSISRAARQQGTQADGFTISEDDRLGAAIRPQPQHVHSRGHHIVAWTLRAAILLMLLGTIGYFGRDSIQTGLDDVRDRIPTNVQNKLGLSPDKEPVDIALNGDDSGENGNDGSGNVSNPEQQANVPVVAPTETQVVTEVAQVEPSEVPVQQTDPTANIGGPTGELPPTTDVDTIVNDPTVPNQEEEPAVEPTDVPVEPTAIPTEEPTTEPEPTEIPVEPTEVPTEEPTTVPEPTLVPTEIPTEIPTEEPTVAPEPTEEPTEEPTIEPTTAPTEIPDESVEATPTLEATEPMVEEPTLEPQAASVLPETTPEQAIVAEGFRYSVEGASVGETVPELPDINSVGGYGEWVVLSMYGQNMSLDPQVFDMSTFRLYADGQEIMVDVGNAWVSGMLGNSPAYGNTDAIQWAPGEGHTFTLTFLAPPGAQSLVLQVGDQSFDLGYALDNPAPLFIEQAPVESDLIQATVVDVIDGETIVVDIDGVQQTVRYLSVNVPTGDACYAAEATEANRNLVEGQTVTLERQATNIDARGNWVRDVWLMNDAGQPILISQQLVLEGAAETDISVPNTRFAGWLQQAQTNAEHDGTGMWGSCGE